MKNLTLLFIFAMAMLLYACGSEETAQEEQKAEEMPESITEGKGIGPIQSIELTDPLDESLIAEGRRFFQTQCRDCHKLDDKTLIGPGFAGITNKRKPEWIMNMITNTEIMLELDPTARELLDISERRAMPHQHLSVTDARAMLEFLRQNDLDTEGTKDQGVVN